MEEVQLQTECHVKETEKPQLFYRKYGLERILMKEGVTICDNYREVELLCTGYRILTNICM
jgi:hypothetical protein